MKDYLLQRLKEPSTWRGIIYMITAAGVPIAPALADSIIAVGLAVAGLIGVLTPGK